MDCCAAEGFARAASLTITASCLPTAAQRIARAASFTGLAAAAPITATQPTVLAAAPSEQMLYDLQQAANAAPRPQAHAATATVVQVQPRYPDTPLKPPHSSPYYPVNQAAAPWGPTAAVAAPVPAAAAKPVHYGQTGSAAVTVKYGSAYGYVNSSQPHAAPAAPPAAAAAGNHLTYPPAAPSTVPTSSSMKQTRSAALDAVASLMGQGFASSLSHLPPGALELLCSGGVVQERAMGYQATCNIQPLGIKVGKVSP